ncbi:MAG: cytochrome c [Planctomycetaceae bacterium]|jgi:mono/diheme cytochrome c family protein|nr:cytochrome c [Planctomycetaceae bacterium]
MIRTNFPIPQHEPKVPCQVCGVLTLLALGISAMFGCGRSDLSYRTNNLHAASLTREGSDRDPRSVGKEAAVLIEKWFGTLDEPLWPRDVLGPDIEPVRMDSVNRCAGPVGRGADKIERGVFRKHCVSCHGLSGDGLGAAAMLLEPYPRDFRRGTFKFKSTPVGQKPTREDIHRTLYEGIPGTAMPSFRALEESKEFSEDVDDLVEYVRYLAIRGEVERRVITAHVREGTDLDVASEQLQQILKQVVQKWANASSEQVVIPDYPEFIGKRIENSQEHLELMSKGKAHFESELTACVKCHGATGAGDGSSQDFDDWTKDWTILAGIDPKHPTDWKEMKVYGALKPVLAKPRNFHWGAYHGGKSPTEIFKRIVLGIEGTPMPPVARAQNGNPGLTDQELWELVYYVTHLEDR